MWVKVADAITHKIMQEAAHMDQRNVHAGAR
jgi:hypothetical protein